ncbi:MAG: CPBP family intramembrane metalloprotease [Gemmatimonadetes bacterium]|nr:CPBP family intramembrane metalloprotease [Gemmatimonadota bacterium]NIO31407.1 CPBP family intramembrane metalloprotease [Gemmatimonadota bacterium]
MRPTASDQRAEQTKESTLPPTAREGAPGIGAALAAFFTGLALALIFTGLGTLINGSLAIAFLLGEFGFLGGVALYFAATGRSVRAALRLVRVPRAVYPLALQLGVALLFFNLAATIILGPPAQDIEFVTTAEGALEQVALVIGVALAAPLIEEALFRGLLQGVLEARLRHRFAIAVTAMAFGLLHGPDGALFFFFWSLPVGWVTWRSGSILPAVVVHAVNNIVGLFGYIAAGPVEPEDIEYGSGAIPLAVTILLVAVYWAYKLCVRADRVGGLGNRPAKLG